MPVDLISLLSFTYSRTLSSYLAVSHLLALTATQVHSLCHFTPWHSLITLSFHSFIPPIYIPLQLMSTFPLQLFTIPNLSNSHSFSLPGILLYPSASILLFLPSIILYNQCLPFLFKCLPYLTLVILNI